MLVNDFVDTAKVMSKGQVTIPRDIREVLKIGPGSRVSFIVEKGSVRIVNSMLFAMSSLQKDMKGEAEKAELTTDESVVELIEQMRKEQCDK